MSNRYHGVSNFKGGIDYLAFASVYGVAGFLLQDISNELRSHGYSSDITSDLGFVTTVIGIVTLWAGIKRLATPFYESGKQVS